MLWRVSLARTGCNAILLLMVRCRVSSTQLSLSADIRSAPLTRRCRIIDITQVVAEGAGQEMMATSDTAERDPSGNLVLSDVGLWMASATRKHFKDLELVRLSPPLP